MNMSAADDDTELRDLLIQNLENNGVLNKLKVSTHLFTPFHVRLGGFKLVALC